MHTYFDLSLFSFSKRQKIMMESSFHFITYLKMNTIWVKKLKCLLRLLKSDNLSVLKSLKAIVNTLNGPTTVMDGQLLINLLPVTYLLKVHFRLVLKSF